MQDGVEGIREFRVPVMQEEAGMAQGAVGDSQIARDLFQLGFLGIGSPAAQHDLPGL